MAWGERQKIDREPELRRALERIESLPTGSHISQARTIAAEVLKPIRTAEAERLVAEAKYKGRAA